MDVSNLVENNASQEPFQTKTHGAFIDAKWLLEAGTGTASNRTRDWTGASVYADIAARRRLVNRPAASCSAPVWR